MTTNAATAPTNQPPSAIEDRANVHREALIDTESAYQQRNGWSMSCLWCDYVTPVEPTRAEALVWMQKHYNDTIPEGAEIR